ncbi:Rz [Burkholderia phage vB_BceS_AH2]|uniref:Rz n=1 Tax=Burkholderia phage vB_BceS_AH2 TaxID=1133022 RepID=I6NTQ1_9CAUD|nr:Rz-like spanin [Burkholderia phage vB_BceS_AH2]AEY69589.1 Rz [Burkholderia phage vB_BceS_AH2]
MNLILSKIGSWCAAALAALAVVAGVFAYGRKKGADAERKNTDLVKAQAEAERQQNAAADAKADAAANQAVADAAQQRREIDNETAAMQPGEAQKDLQDNWSRD